MFTLILIDCIIALETILSEVGFVNFKMRGANRYGNSVCDVTHTIYLLVAIDILFHGHGINHNADDDNQICIDFDNAPWLSIVKQILGQVRDCISCSMIACSS